MPINESNIVWDKPPEVTPKQVIWDIEGDPFDVDEYVEKQGTTLPIYQNTKKDFSDVMYPLFRPFLATGLTAAKAINTGMGTFSTHLDVLSEYVEEKTGFKSGGLFEQAAKVYEDNAEYWKKKADKTGISFMDELLGEAIGGAVPGVGEFILNIPYSAALGAAEAQKEDGSEIAGALVEGGKRGVLGLIFHAIHPLKQYLRAPTMGTVFGVQSMTEGGSPKDIAKGFGTGILYSMSSPGGQMGLNELKKNIKSEVAFRDSKAKLIEELEEKPTEIPDETFEDLPPAEPKPLTADMIPEGAKVKTRRMSDEGVTEVEISAKEAFKEIKDNETTTNRLKELINCLKG